jgi:hypothetical protein
LKTADFVIGVLNGLNRHRYSIRFPKTYPNVAPFRVHHRYHLTSNGS